MERSMTTNVPCATALHHGMDFDDTEKYEWKDHGQQMWG
jgi:hypothetical protein